MNNTDFVNIYWFSVFLSLFLCFCLLISLLYSFLSSLPASLTEVMRLLNRSLGPASSSLGRNGVSVSLGRSHVNSLGVLVV